MTVREFRSIALSLPQVSEAAHMGHPDFRVGGRIFATLGYPRSGWGMVKLTREQQELFVRAQPVAFAPVKGAWGRAGATNVRFDIKHWDEKPYSEGKDLPKLTRGSVTKTFTGDIEGEGQVEYLMMYRSDGSATFVGLERVVGRLAGKAGSFVLQRTGVFEGGVARESYSVVPGSGTGELRGLRGEGVTAVGHGLEHPMTLTYDLG